MFVITLKPHTNVANTTVIKGSKRDPNSENSHIWRAYLTLEIVKQDKCPKYDLFYNLLCQDSALPLLVKFISKTIKSKSDEK
jgi:hypothetical protein